MSENPGEERIASALWKRVAIRLLHRYFLLVRGMTLGVRAACFDESGRVFLVRHTYVEGWHMPGGGVERHEHARQALDKELREEGNLEALTPPQLFQVYFNRQVTSRDHVLFYRVLVRQTAPRLPDREIAECGFFDPDALPEGTTPATRRRLKEVAGELPPADFW